MPRIVNIIQARMGSIRFPGKMMADLHGQPVIDWVLKRCLRSSLVEQTILATSNLERDEPLAKRAELLGVEVFRGDEEDVLSRYATVCKNTNADIVVRVCGDRPLIDASLVDLAIEYFIEYDAVDLAYNHISGDGQNWPRGFGAEVLSAEHIIMMSETLNDPYYREHVTPYLWQNLDKYNVQAVSCLAELDCGIPDIECDLDTEADLQLISAITEGLSANATAIDYFANWKKVTNFNDK